VKAIFLDRDEVIHRLREIAQKALRAFPEVQEVRLIGSLATGTHSGTSDVDLVVRLSRVIGNPVELMRPYYFFFSGHLDLGMDLLLMGPDTPPGMERVLEGSIVLASRGGG